MTQANVPGTKIGSVKKPRIFESLHAVLRNILQSVQPSVVQNSLIAPQVPQQEITNPLAPNANQLVIPQQTGGLLGAFAQASSAGKGLGAFGKSLGAFPPGLGGSGANGFPGFNSIGQAPGLGSAIAAPIAIPTALGSIPTALGGLPHPDVGFPSAGKNFKSVSPEAAPPPDPFGASAGRNLGPPPDAFLFTTPLSPFVTDGTTITEVTTTERKSAERKTSSKEKAPKGGEQDLHVSGRQEVSLKALQEKRKAGNTDVLDATTSASEAVSEDTVQETEFAASLGTETTSEVEQSQQIETTTELSAAETTYLPPRKSTENALTRDQRRLNEINARMHRVLASRKSQRGSDDRKGFLSKFRKPVPEVEKEVDLQTIDSVVEAFAGSSPRLIRDAAIFNVDQAPVQLRAFQDERFHFLNGRTGFGTINERGGAWQPSKSGLSSPLATGVGRADEQGAHVQGNVQLPKKWTEGHTFSLDGSLNRNNNNDLFSGVEFLRWNQ
uniref:Uncharacterized protein n=1 Tax=Romanomermis culicivorax TaxID=13658 RepID=A0A915J750_ROMCU